MESQTLQSVCFSGTWAPQSKPGHLHRGPQSCTKGDETSTAYKLIHVLRWDHIRTLVNTYSGLLVGESARGHPPKRKNNPPRAECFKQKLSNEQQWNNRTSVHFRRNYNVTSAQYMKSNGCKWPEDGQTDGFHFNELMKGHWLRKVPFQIKWSPFGFNLGSNESSSQLLMLYDVVMDGDVHVVKDVKSILFIKVRLGNQKAETG